MSTENVNRNVNVNRNQATLTATAGGATGATASGSPHPPLPAPPMATSDHLAIICTINGRRPTASTGVIATAGARTGTDELPLVRMSSRLKRAAMAYTWDQEMMRLHHRIDEVEKQNRKLRGMLSDAIGICDAAIAETTQAGTRFRHCRTSCLFPSSQAAG